jgi:hypothetical protein
MHMKIVHDLSVGTERQGKAKEAESDEYHDR